MSDNTAFALVLIIPVVISFALWGICQVALLYTEHRASKRRDRYFDNLPTVLDQLINDPRHSLLEIVEEAERRAIREFNPETINQY